MKSQATSLVLGMALAVVAPAVMADFWSDAKRTIGDVADAGWRTTVAPYKTVINAAQGGNSHDIFKPYQEAARVSGDALEGGYSLAREPEKYLYEKVQKYSTKWGGDTGGFFFDIGTFNQSLMSELGTAGANATANALRGQNPLQITAAPLAAAIRAARNSHIDNARPIPDDVKLGLRGIIKDETLARAKYAVGRVEITLPNFIGQGRRFMGGDYAVTVDDIIVFNEAPPSLAENKFWWAHELAHVGQYREWGVEKFAWNYVRDFGAWIENNADEHGQSATGAPPPNGGTAYYGTQLGLQTQPAPWASNSGGPQVPADPYVPRHSPEYFVVQCFFPRDPYPVYYLVTNTSKIIAVNPITGQWLQVGWATPPMFNGAAWTYQTQYLSYSVLPNGQIVFSDNFGRWQAVGFTQTL